MSVVSDRLLPRGRDPTKVLAAPSVYLDHVALVEEEGDLDHRPGLEGRRLGAPRSRIATDSRIGLRDLKLDEVRQLDRDGALVDEQDLDLGVLPEEVPGLADLLGGQRDLIVGVQI